MPSPLNVLSRLILTTLGCRYCFHSHLPDEELRPTDCDLFMIIAYNGRAGFESRSIANRITVTQRFMGPGAPPSATGKTNHSRCKATPPLLPL